MADSEILPIAALLDQALALSREDADSDERWALVDALRTRGDEEAIIAATNWCSSDDLVERELAADLLGQFGWREDDAKNIVYPFSDRAMPLLELLLDDREERVIASAVYSLWRYEVDERLLVRPSLAKHASADVRQAIATVLGGPDSKPAIDTLIVLTSDEDQDVRDWATFGLGTQSNFDTPEIREALYQRLNDPFSEARDEALVGLARRKDSRVVSHIEKALRADSVGITAIEAAGHMASPELVAALEDLPPAMDDYDKDELEQALQRCKGDADPNDESYRSLHDQIVVPPWAKNPSES